jgi:hypothetical protein
MGSKMENFRQFVSKHPLLREEVRNNKFTWQNVYEEWVLYGEEDESWKKYEKQEQTNTNTFDTSQEEPQTNNDQTQSNSTVNLDSIKSIMNYVQKINPDSLNKTLNTVQKVIQIAQTFSGPKSIPNIPTSSIYSDWWD